MATQFTPPTATLAYVLHVVQIISPRSKDIEQETVWAWQERNGLRGRVLRWAWVRSEVVRVALWVGFPWRNVKVVRWNVLAS